MAIRECDCKEFQDSGHTDECNEHYGKTAPMKPDKEPEPQRVGVIGIDTGSKDGDCTVYGYFDEKDIIVITNIEYASIAEKEVYNAINESVTDAISDEHMTQIMNAIRPYLQTNTAHHCREVREPESTGEDCGRTVQGGSINTTELEKVSKLLKRIINHTAAYPDITPHMVIGYDLIQIEKLGNEALTIINRMIGKGE